MKTSFITIATTIILLSSCNQKQQPFEGKIKRETLSIAPKYAGRIQTIFVKEGDIVNAGDTLAFIDIPEIEAKKQQAEGALHAATYQHAMALKGATKEQKDQAIAAFNAANDQYLLAEKSLARVKNLYMDSLVSAQNYDEVLTKYLMAQAQLSAATAKKQEVCGSIRNEQIEMAMGQKMQAQGAVQETKTVMSERYLIAPKKMSIETIALKEGELALAGYNFFIGYDATTTWIRLTIGESEIHKFEKGKVYKVNTTFNNKTVDATLTSINELARYGARTSSYPNYQPGETVYELHFTPINQTEVADLYINYSVYIDQE